MAADPTAADEGTAPLRVAFVGQGVYFRQCVLEHPVDAIEPAFIDFREGASANSLLASLADVDPDAILVFRPEIVPAGLFRDVRAVTVGYLTEPLPRKGGTEHADLKERLRWLEVVDPANFDRIVSFDPLIAETAESVLPVWRSLPIPVADSLFADVRPRSAPPRILFVGRSTEHREQMMGSSKRRHGIIHIGHGLFGGQLAGFLAEADVQLNLHNNPYPSFENRVCIALASGQLVISEPLSPTHGLVPGEHFLEVTSPEELLSTLDRVAAEPEAYEDVQRAGRREAERFRASLVYPSLIRDAIADVTAGGVRRPLPV